MEKRMISLRLDDLAEGDVHLGNLSAYTKHLLSVKDPDRAAHNAGQLYSIAIDAFQQAGITNVRWNPNLISRDWFEKIQYIEREISGKRMSARSGLQKRLQRARKSCSLVDAFGMSVRNNVPEVSVSRVDVLRMEELRLLADGSYMKTEVESFRQKQDSLKGMRPV
ncbi:hypothetical protein QFC20_007117 [Naganishia adeliensis]|uniref:Uncharacterized protein n=1 Tax=Naganishia adeliensis TaxID=92952 RepID=A0ACC2V322_9TREE|nr:hypothetical protein QFC20_007117 [Naganishia adeliensis]